MIAKFAVVLFRCGWVGVLISGLASYMSSQEAADAAVDENAKSARAAREANAIRLAQYERERRLEESKFKYQQEQDKIAQFERMINSNASAKERVASIWEGR